MFFGRSPDGVKIQRISRYAIDTNRNAIRKRLDRCLRLAKIILVGIRYCFQKEKIKTPCSNKPLSSESKQKTRERKPYEIIKTDRLECTRTAKMVIIIIYDLERIKTERDDIVTATAVSNSNNNRRNSICPAKIYVYHYTNDIMHTGTVILASIRWPDF